MTTVNKLMKSICAGKVSGRFLLYGMLLFAPGLFFPSCVRDEVPSKNLGEDEAWVSVTVKLPQSAVPATRAEAEQEISEIRILVFESDGNDYLFSYQVPGSEITSTGENNFKALLRASASPLKLMVLANVEASLASFAPAEGTPEADIREEIEIAFPAGGMTGNLPMYGESVLANGLGNGETHITMNALRAVARVDVKMNLGAESGAFILEEVQLFRVYDKLRLIPDAVADPAAPKVTAPSIPDDAAFLANPVTKAVVGDADSITHLYIPESYPAGGSIAQRDGTTVVVVGGRFDGSGQTTYYRADFDPGVAGHPFGQVLRNHRYTFNIVKVSAAGWASPIDAATNFATSIVVEIQAWEDFSSELYFGENRFAVSSREISLRFARNRLKELDVESTLPYTIQWLDGNGTPTGTPTSEQDVAIGNGNFEVTIRKNPGDAETVSHLEFRTLLNNLRGSTVLSDRLRITVENWSVDITVNQDNGAVYSDRVFNVLTGHDATSVVGNLGTSTTLPTYNAGLSYYGGLGMRMILDTHFVPGGSVGIGGFSFEEIGDSWTESVSLSINTAASLAAIDRLLRAQHVIYLTYATEEHSDVATRLMTWLNESPNRVLIVGTDDASTNQQIRNRLTGDGNWQFGISTGTYSRAPDSAGSDDFFSGPFGQVGSVNFTKQDNTAGYSTDCTSNVTPLIRATFNTNAMVFGVNKGSRIVYHGDANLFHPPQLSGVTGAVNSDLDILMANVWAWIVEQLIYGDD